MNKDKRYEIMKRLAAIRPNPKSELEYASPYELLVAVVLSAQATDKSVNLATRKLYPVANTPQAMVKLDVEGLTPYIKTIGLYRNKAKHVIALSQQLIDRFGGVVPDDREALESLPGVGRKTANVVLNVAFGHPTIAVDTHIFRVSNRTGFAPGKTPEEVEKKLLKFVPEALKRTLITGFCYTDVIAAKPPNRTVIIVRYWICVNTRKRTSPLPLDRLFFLVPIK